MLPVKSLSAAVTIGHKFALHGNGTSGANIVSGFSIKARGDDHDLSDLHSQPETYGIQKEVP